MELIVDKTLTFSRKDDKTNCCVEFEVPRGFDVLKCECRFSPKVVEDEELCRQVVRANIGKYLPRAEAEAYPDVPLPLVNHLTFSLDFGDAYIGCAHRHSAKAVHYIAAGGSSPGFVCQKAQAGMWRAVINIHSITSPKVTYSLKISSLTQEEYENEI